MRALIAVLLVANLALLGYGLLASREREGAEARLLENQVNAARIRIVRGEPEPVPPPAPEVCVEWAPLTAEELARAREALQPLALGDRLGASPVTVTTGWWVYVPPQKTRAAADRELARLAAAGVRDTFLVQETGDMRFAISLGIFRTEEAALRFRDGLKARGVTNAVAGPRAHQARLNALYVRGAKESDTARLVELKAGFPGTEVRAAKCP